MNAVGLSVLWATLQITLLGLMTAAMYLLTRRISPKLGATTIFCGLAGMGLAVVLTFVPLPAWTTQLQSYLASTTIKEIETPEVQPASASDEDTNHAELPSASTPSYVSMAREIWLSGAATESPNDIARSQTGVAKTPFWPTRWSSVFGLLALAAVAFGFCRLLIGLSATRRYRQHSQPLDAPEISETLDVLKAQLSCHLSID